MKSFSMNLVALLALLSASSALPTDSSTPENDTPDAITLKPISIRDYEVAKGLQQRDSKEFTDLDPQTQSQLIYGSPGNDGQQLLAEMTLYAPNGLQIVLMEKFEQLTSAVDCNADDGKMSLTFKSKSAYDSALSKWSFINENKDDRFLLIANHAGCGPEDERQPYYITDVDDQADKNTVFLMAKDAPWSEIAGTYDLNFGKATTKKLRTRGWWDDVKDGLGDAYQATSDAVQEVGGDIADNVQGDADLSKSLTFPVSAGTENQKSLLYKNEAGTLQLDCVNCFVKGSFKVVGHVKVESWSLKDLSIDASPQDFHAAVKLEATLSASNSPLTLGNQKEIFSAPVPYAGVTVPKIFKLGAVFSYTVGFNTTFKGEGVVDFGVASRIPNTAKATLDLDSASKSSATGFDGTLTPLFEVKSLSASVSVAAFSTPKLNFGIELNNIGKANIGLSMKLPEVSSTLMAKYAADGACASDKTVKTGVDLTNEVKLALSAEANAAFGSDEEDALPKWSHELWSKPFALPGHCWPIDIPALLPASAKGSEQEAPAKPKSTTAAAPAPSVPVGGGGGCRKIKRDKLGRRRVVAC